MNTSLKRLIITPAILLSTVAPLLAQVDDTATPQSSAGGTIGGAVGGFIGLVVGVILVISLWKIFSKAGYPGWASIIPIYNLYVMCKIAGMSPWWILGFCVPFLNFIAAILLSLGIARSFGKGAGFGIGLLLLSFIFYPILAFSSARYSPPLGAGAAPLPA